MGRVVGCLHRQQKINVWLIRFERRRAAMGSSSSTCCRPKDVRCAGKSAFCRPKRAKTAYNCYIQEQMRICLKGKPQSRAGMQRMMTCLAACWMKMPDEDREPYVRAAAKDKIRYDKEMAKFECDGYQEIRRPRSGYIIFMSRFMKKNKGKCKDGKELICAGARVWRNMSDEEKECYNSQSLKERERYQDELSRNDCYEDVQSRKDVDCIRRVIHPSQSRNHLSQSPKICPGSVYHCQVTECRSRSCPGIKTVIDGDDDDDDCGDDDDDDDDGDDDCEDPCSSKSDFRSSD